MVTPHSLMMSSASGTMFCLLTDCCLTVVHSNAVPKKKKSQRKHCRVQVAAVLCLVLHASESQDHSGAEVERAIVRQASQPFAHVGSDRDSPRATLAYRLGCDRDSWLSISGNASGAGLNVVSSLVFVSMAPMFKRTSPRRCTDMLFWGRNIEVWCHDPLDELTTFPSHGQSNLLSHDVSCRIIPL